MRLTLIGMSGAGKSTWSRHLAEAGYRRFGCDDRITGKLVAHSAGGRPGPVRPKLGPWLGFPDQAGYPEREGRYLAWEIEVMDEILGFLEDPEHGWETDVVVDTTGSVIYTGERTLERLRRQTTVVYLAAAPEARQDLLRAYEANQRPVLWMGMFQRHPGESRKSALSRCYPRLLEARCRLYRRLAHVTIDHRLIRGGGFGVKDFLKKVCQRQ